MTMEHEELDFSPIHLLHRAGQFAGDIFSEEVQTEDLTPRQYAVLVTVAQNEGVSQTKLVDKTGIDRSTLADIVRRMLKKGLIQRRRDRRDARAYSVRLTDKGTESLKSAEPAAVCADERILSALSSEQRENFLDLLSTIVNSVECAGEQKQ